MSPFGMSAIRLLVVTFAISLALVIPDSSTVENHVIDLTNQSSTKDNSTEYSTNHSEDGSHHIDSHHRVEVVEIRYNDIKEPFMITVVVLVAAISKIGFHYANKLSSIVPESCLLCIVGTAFGCIIYFSGSGTDLQHFFTPDTFFNYLLPPIILESAFSLYDRTFTDNIGSILIFAVLGTVTSCLILGMSLIGLQMTNAMEYVGDPVQLFVFSALIVAVDPVAVLAVFNEVGVNRVLYFLVFGESLLNDGVTVVLYNVLQSYNLIIQERPIHAEDIILGVVKFGVVCFGGLTIGVIIGALCSVLTKYTNNVKVIEPVAIFGLAYIAFLLAEMFHFSGIISMIACGLIQVAYAFTNITQKSRITVKFFSKVLSTTSEIIIFLFLGLLLVRTHKWSTSFTLWTQFLITMYRFLVVFVISTLINRFDKHGVRRIRYDEMFIMSYGGIRGAVCFSLVALLDQGAFPMKDTFVTSTLFVIFFTVFVQGATIRPFVTLLQVKLASKSKEIRMFEELSAHVNDHIIAGIEEIVAKEGRAATREWFYHLDEKYIRRVLLRDHKLNEEQYEILQCYEKLVMKEHYKNLQMCGAKKLPKDADTLRTVDSSAIIRQIRKASIVPMSDNVLMEENESDTSEVEFTVDLDVSSSTEDLRKVLDRNINKPSNHMNVFGFSKYSGLKADDRRRMRRPSLSLEEYTNKRNNNKRLQRSIFMKHKWNRPNSWSEENATSTQEREDLEMGPERRPRSMTVDVNRTSARDTRAHLFELTHKVLLETEETQDDSVDSRSEETIEAEPLLNGIKKKMEIGDRSEVMEVPSLQEDDKSNSTDNVRRLSRSSRRHGQLTRQISITDSDESIEHIELNDKHDDIDTD